MSESTHGAWSSRIMFILAAAGSAVGLGNIWKFPFEVSNGGGAAFLLMYLFFCFILCLPLLFNLCSGPHILTSCDPSNDQKDTRPDDPDDPILDRSWPRRPCESIACWSLTSF